MNLKNFLPFENFTLTTKLSIEEVRNRINEKIDPKQTGVFSFSNRKSTKPYEGQLINDTFTISRVINYRNSFLPIIKGQITTSLGYTQIHISMRPMTFVTIFISFWLGVVGLVCIGILVAAIFQFQKILQHGFSPMILIPFAMFIFGCLLTVFAFKGESKNSKEFLTRLLEAKNS